MILNLPVSFREMLITVSISKLSYNKSLGRSYAYEGIVRNFNPTVGY